MTKPSLGAVLQSEALLRQFAKDLLQVPRAHGTTTTHPLSVLLFLLDLLAFLHQSEASPAPGEATTEKGTVVGLGLLGDVTLSELPRGGGEEDGVLEAARRWERRNAGSAPSSPAVGSDELDSWKAFSGYLAELYLYPLPTASPTPAGSATSTPWISPFHLAKNDLPSLRALCSIDRPDSARAILEIAALEATLFLETVYYTPDSTREPIDLPQLIRNPPSKISIPTSFPTISTILSTRRLATTAFDQSPDPLTSPVTPSVLTFRWILSTVLAQRFPGGGFKVEERGGVVCYSEDERDSKAIATSWEDETSVEDEDDFGCGVEQAKATIVRKDAKLAWIFGDNAHGPSTDASRRPQTAPNSQVNSPVMTARSPVIQQLRSKQNRHSVTPSLDSFAGLDSPTSSTHTRRRLLSTGSSSSVPFLDPNASPTPSRTAPAMLPIDSGAFDSVEPRSFTPFINLAPIPPSPIRSNTTESFELSILAARNGQVPPSKNALSADEKRDLVWRSSKLKHYFGVPMQEGAAEKVLVESRPTFRKDSTGSGRRQSFPPSASFGRVIYPPSPLDFTSPFSPSHSPTHFQTSQPVSPCTVTDTPSTQNTIESIASRQLEPQLIFIPRNISPTSTPDSPGFPMGSTEQLVAQQLKEERRRKIRKLEKLLGERVPVHLALNAGLVDSMRGSGGSGGGIESAPMSRTGSSKLTEMIREKLGLRDRRDEGAASEQWIVVDEPGRDSMVLPPPAVGSIEGLAKTKKMESIFGDIPPQALYLSSEGAPRRYSDTSSLSSYPLASPPPTVPNSARSTRTSEASLRYRASIASLQYLIEENPHSLPGLTKDYGSRSPSPEGSPKDLSRSSSMEEDRRAADEELRGFINRDSTIPSHDPETTSILNRYSNVSSAFTPSSRAPSSLLNHSPTSSKLERTASTGSQRTIKKAAKLASFFGTSRGEVWGLLLDDLEASIAEEEGMDEEEREEGLAGVAKLRHSRIGG